MFVHELVRRSILLLIITTLCLIVSACSFSVEFVVINSSNSLIEIEYQLKTPMNNYTKPLKMSAKDWNSWFGEKKWQDIPSNEFEYDTNSHQCRIKLNSDEVLLLTSTDDSILHNNNYDYFNVINLTIKGKYGEVNLKNDQLYNQFERKNTQTYFINYKQINDSQRKD